MRKVLLIVLIFVLVPLILAGMEYNVTIQKKGYLYHIIGTDYYLKISGYYEYGYKNAILNTNTRTISIETNYIYGSKIKYNVYPYSAFEKITLPVGTIDQNGMLIYDIYIPTIIK